MLTAALRPHDATPFIRACRQPRSGAGIRTPISRLTACRLAIGRHRNERWSREPGGISQDHLVAGAGFEPAFCRVMSPFSDRTAGPRTMKPTRRWGAGQARSPTGARTLFPGAKTPHPTHRRWDPETERAVRYLGLLQPYGWADRGLALHLCCHPHHLGLIRFGRAPTLPPPRAQSYRQRDSDPRSPP